MQPPGTPLFPRGVGACCKCPEGNQCILSMDAGHPANRCWIVRNSPACQKKNGRAGKIRKCLWWRSKVAVAVAVGVAAAAAVSVVAAVAVAVAVAAAVM